jgi:hypothetical protein
MFHSPPRPCSPYAESCTTPSRSTPPTPQDVLKSSVAAVLQGQTNNDKPLPRLKSVKVFKWFGGWVVLVRFNADKNLTTGLTKRGIELDMEEIDKAVYKSGLPISYVATSALFPVTTTLGDTTQALVYETRLDGKIGRRINWKNVDSVDSAGCGRSFFINQSFR